MEPFLTWLQDLPFSIAIRESESVWGYPFVLFLHTLGIALTGGSAAVILVRILGFPRSLPVQAVRHLFPYLWTGFVLNAITGTLLFCAGATSIGYVPLYYAKLVLILFAMLTLLPVRRFIDSDRAAADGHIPSRIVRLAALSLLLWAGVVTTGRLVSYFR